jgi:hypothetical protein
LNRWFFNFQTRQWERRYDLADLLTVGVMENSADAGRAARALIHQLEFVGARDEMLKTLAALREVGEPSRVAESRCPAPLVAECSRIWDLGFEVGRMTGLEPATS